ncbi:MAG: hypothetical protein V4685_10305 [Bacteroidota bacterium]
MKNKKTKLGYAHSAALKICLVIIVGLLSVINTKAQFTTTWALTANKNVTAITGAQAANVNAGTMVPGVNFPNPGSHNTDGYRCQIASGSWPSVETDGNNIDFPFSPAAGFDLTITSISFAAKTSGSSGSNRVSLAYQADGAGPWIPFGTVQDVPSGGTTNINFTPLNTMLFNGHTYIVRVYVFSDGAPTSSRTISIKNVVIDGTAVIGGTPPTITTDSARATGKYTGIGYGTLTAGTLAVTASGVCWGLLPDPVITGGVNSGGPLTSGSIGNGTGGNISGLTAGTTYHVRAYATTLAGTIYGADSTFTTVQLQHPH